MFVEVLDPNLIKSQHLACLCGCRINRPASSLLPGLLLQCHLPHLDNYESRMKSATPQAGLPARHRWEAPKIGGDFEGVAVKPPSAIGESPPSQRIRPGKGYLLEKNVHPQGSRDHGMTLGTSFPNLSFCLSILRPANSNSPFSSAAPSFDFQHDPSSSCSAARVAQSPTPCNHIYVSRQSTVQSGSSRPGSASRFHLLSTRRLVGSPQRSATPSDRHSTARSRVPTGNRPLPST